MLYYYINFYIKFILMSLSIIVLAAGKGSRMLSKTPKVLHEVKLSNVVSRFRYGSIY